MTELLQAAVAPPNLPATGLLIFVLLYWLTVIIGLLDFKTLDLDLHVDSTHDVAHDAHLSVAWLNHALAFFNLGRVPLMLFLSFVALPLWVGSILTNYYTHNTSLLLGLAFGVPLFLGSLLVAKVLTTPFVKLFATLEKDPAGGVSPIGKMCTVLLPASYEQLGQAVVKANGDTLMLNVKAASAATELHKGDTALIIDYSARSRCYLIEPYDDDAR
ncbi:OB-fold-containig protein [Hymenobacter lucidus]|uniref:DUF1449 family protein n=1 Tax=Hymenobacter lucidus TaxID=2880930 RepID=A0ABS8ATT5_9BACT|nr:OB-fold-containig protein [Hymenobacter lucidus]MCB2408819.1 DUF1449 family protein [Hymenobacter lucidus]